MRRSDSEQRAKQMISSKKCALSKKEKHPVPNLDEVSFGNTTTSTTTTSATDTTTIVNTFTDIFKYLINYVK